MVAQPNVPKYDPTTGTVTLIDGTSITGGPITAPTTPPTQRTQTHWNFFLGGT